MINQNTFNDEKKLKRSKKIKLIMILSVLAVLFISYGLDLTNDKQQINNNLKVISYLENKYNQKFEIIQLVDSRQYEKPAIGCDGSTFVPARKVKDKYEYDYEVLSITDNVKFNVYYLDDKGTDNFEDSYIESKNVIKTIEEISNHIISDIGNINTQKTFDVVEKNFQLTYYCNINIYFNENLNEILDKNYINKLQAIRLYTNSIIDSYTKNYSDIYNTNSYSYMIFNVYIHYQDEKYIKVNEAKTLYVFNENSTSGINIESYWRNLDD